MSFGMASFFFLNIKCDQHNLKSTLNFPTWQTALFQATVSYLEHRRTVVIQRLSENWKHPVWDLKSKSLALSQQGSFGGCSLSFFFFLIAYFLTRLLKDSLGSLSYFPNRPGNFFMCFIFILRAGKDG